MKKSGKKLGIILLLMGIMILGVLGCEKKEVSKKPQEEPKKNEEPQKEEPAQEEKVLNVGVLKNLDMLPGIMIENEDLDQKAGFSLNLVVYDTAKELEEDFSQHKVDVIFGDLSEEFTLKGKGLEARIIGRTDGDVVLLTGQNSGIDQVDQCKDMDVILSKQPEMLYSLHYLLAQFNFRGDFVKNRQVSSYDDVLEMVNADDQKLYLLPEPYATKAVEKGAKVLARNYDSRFCPGAILTTAMVADEHMELLENFGKAYNEAVELMATMEAAEIKAKLLNNDKTSAYIERVESFPEYRLMQVPTDEELMDAYEWAKNNQLFNGEYNREDCILKVVE